MWFKNIIAYRFSQPCDITAEAIEEQLQAKRFRPCFSQEVSSYGFVPPLGKHGDMLHHAANGYILVRACHQEKILPASVIQDALDEKVAKIEHENDRTVYSKEKKDLKEQVIMELLPKAFTRNQSIMAYIDTQRGWLIVDSASYKKAEALTSALRECVGSLPVAAPALKNMPSFTMTRWLDEELDLPYNLFLGDECELREPADDGGQIKVRKQELIGDEVSVHLQAGKIVSRLGLIWDDALSFVLGDDLVFRRVKFLEGIQSQLDDINANSAAEQFDADFTLMSATFTKLIDEMMVNLGGFSDEVQPVVASAGGDNPPW